MQLWGIDEGRSCEERRHILRFLRIERSRLKSVGRGVWGWRCARGRRWRGRLPAGEFIPNRHPARCWQTGGLDLTDWWQVSWLRSMMKNNFWRVLPNLGHVITYPLDNFSSSISTLLLEPWIRQLLWRLCSEVCISSSLEISVKSIMDETSHDPDAAASLRPPVDDRLLVKWLESQPGEIQSKQVSFLFSRNILTAFYQSCWRQAWGTPGKSCPTPPCFRTRMHQTLLLHWTVQKLRVVFASEPSLFQEDMPQSIQFLYWMERKESASKHASSGWAYLGSDRQESRPADEYCCKDFRSREEYVYHHPSSFSAFGETCFQGLRMFLEQKDNFHTGIDWCLQAPPASHVSWKCYRDRRNQRRMGLSVLRSLRVDGFSRHFSCHEQIPRNSLSRIEERFWWDFLNKSHCFVAALDPWRSQGGSLKPSKMSRTISSHRYSSLIDQALSSS